MTEARYKEIKKSYDDYYNSLLKIGKFPYKTTEKGIWTPSVTDEVYQLFQKIKLNKSQSFLDFGSGDGKVSIIASLFTKSEGIEHDKELHDKATDLNRKLKTGVIFHNKDFMTHDISHYSVVFLNPDARFADMEGKFRKELNGKLVIYGPEFHPKTLKKEQSLNIGGTPISIYTN